MSTPTPDTLAELSDDFLDAFADTMAGRCCDCPPCNHYLPDYEQHKDEPCVVLDLVRSEVARHVAAEKAKTDRFKSLQSSAAKSGSEMEDRYDAEFRAHASTMLELEAAKKDRDEHAEAGEWNEARAEVALRERGVFRIKWKNAQAHAEKVEQELLRRAHELRISTAATVKAEQERDEAQMERADLLLAYAALVARINALADEERLVSTSELRAALTEKEQD